MAGIGFELRRLFDKRGIVSKMRAYAYTSLVVTGPMLLGVAFIGSVQLMGTAFGLPVNDRNLLVCMTTYALLGSLILTGTISMPVTRYIADMLYQERNDLVLPSFEGSLMILLPIGFLACLAFQLQTGQGFTLVVLNLMLFCELIVVWMATSYLTAIKDYRSILIAYFLAIGTSFLVSWVAYRILGPTLEGFMLGVAFGYGVMIIYSVLLLYRYFPNARRHYLLWVSWLGQYRDLIIVGLSSYVGLFSFIVISWLGPQGIQVAPMYYASPERDTASFFAYLSVLITQVTFVVSTEVNFYPSYRHYYDLFNADGSITEIDGQQEEMLLILERELGDLSLKQIIASGLSISVGSTLLQSLPLGFTPTMGSYFVILCVGYCAYAIGNVVTLMCLYYSNIHGAAIANATFGITSLVHSLAATALPEEYYSLGFVIASLVYLFVSWLRLFLYTRNLPYTILSNQPLVAQERTGLLEKISRLY